MAQTEANYPEYAKYIFIVNGELSTIALLDI